MPGALNVDRVAMPGVIQWDVDGFPWPWADQSFDDVYVIHLFEHIFDPLGFMAEAYRVLTVGGLLHLEVPHWKSQNAYTDPTHRRFCTEDTFRYWVPGNWLSDMAGAGYHRGCLFDEVSNEVVSGDLRVVLQRR